jgi:hypothetical protein
MYPGNACGAGKGKQTDTQVFPCRASMYDWKPNQENAAIRLARVDDPG